MKSKNDFYQLSQEFMQAENPKQLKDLVKQATDSLSILKGWKAEAIKLNLIMLSDSIDYIFKEEKKGKRLFINFNGIKNLLAAHLQRF